MLFSSTMWQFGLDTKFEPDPGWQPWSNMAIMVWHGMIMVIHTRHGMIMVRSWHGHQKMVTCHNTQSHNTQYHNTPYQNTQCDIIPTTTTMPHAIIAKIKVQLLVNWYLSNYQRLSIFWKSVIWIRSEWYQ